MAAPPRSDDSDAHAGESAVPAAGAPVDDDAGGPAAAASVPLDAPAHGVVAAAGTSASDYDYQKVLAERAGAKEDNVLLSVARTLNAVVLYPEAKNSDTNRRLWDTYANEWDPSDSWVQRMASGVGVAPDEAPERLRFVGDEWSTPESLSRVLDDFVRPYVSSDATVACEIGSGGGRVASRVCEWVKELTCFDISSGMLARCRKALRGYGNVKFSLLGEEGAFPPTAAGAFDFVYSFDVFVHMDLHTMWRHFNHIRALLKPDGVAFVSTANLMAPDGWARFERQERFTVGGFYFVTPDQVDLLVDKAGMQVIKRAPFRDDTSDASGAGGADGGDGDGGGGDAGEWRDNVYYRRDYVIAMKVKGAAP